MLFYIFIFMAFILIRRYMIHIKLKKIGVSEYAIDLENTQYTIFRLVVNVVVLYH